MLTNNPEYREKDLSFSQTARTVRTNEAEISDILSSFREEFSINQKGQVTTSIRGAARLAGVDHSSLVKLLRNIKEDSRVNCPASIESLKGTDLSCIGTDGFSENQVAFLIQYYALEAGKNCREQAKKVLSALFLVGYRTWVHTQLGWKKKEARVEEGANGWTDETYLPKLQLQAKISEDQVKKSEASRDKAIAEARRSEALRDKAIAEQKKAEIQLRLEEMKLEQRAEKRKREAAEISPEKIGLKAWNKWRGSTIQCPSVMRDLARKSSRRGNGTTTLSKEDYMPALDWLVENGLGRYLKPRKFEFFQEKKKQS